MSEPILALEAVTVAYRERLAIQGIDLTIAAGERVALIGPNGAGKSTLLAVSTGAIEPTSGVVRIGGRRLDTMSRADVARRVAVVPGSVNLPFAMRVEEVVALGRLPYEDPFRGLRPADRSAILAAIERVGIGHLLGRDARELSLGERQLVLIALALAQGTEILILDEPTVHLDLRHQVEAMGLLADLNSRDGTTVVAVLHDLALAAHFFPRVVILDHGRIVADGPPTETLDGDRIRTIFGVDPALVRLPVRP